MGLCEGGPVREIAAQLVLDARRVERGHAQTVEHGQFRAQAGALVLMLLDSFEQRGQLSTFCHGVREPIQCSPPLWQAPSASSAVAKLGRRPEDEVAGGLSPRPC